LQIEGLPSLINVPDCGTGRASRRWCILFGLI
jgi:hypothetical protein